MGQTENSTGWLDKQGLYWQSPARKKPAREATTLTDVTGKLCPIVKKDIQNGN